MIKADKANRTLDFIRDNPKEWSQGTWEKCFAGITLRLEGVDPDGLPADDVERAAGEILGLKMLKCDCCDVFRAIDKGLFDGDNTLEDLERIVKELTENEPALSA